VIRRKRIQAIVASLLEKNGITAVPVPVNQIARAEGAHLYFAALDGDLSGFLYREGSQATIGVNTHHASVRQRFTVGHELGHLVLHHHDQLHVDYKFRNTQSAEGTDPEEIEANLFAAELLMPRVFLEEDHRNTAIDLADEEVIFDLAHKYGVSTQALAIRLTTLGYLP
jgi:Zn-dependent peptidase ImmA (M78 family)